MLLSWILWPSCPPLESLLPVLIVVSPMDPVSDCGWLFTSDIGGGGRGMLVQYCAFNYGSTLCSLLESLW